MSNLGPLCIVGAMLAFTAQDATMKWLSPSYALHELVFVRAVLAISITLVIMRFEGGLRVLVTPRIGWHLLRGLLMVTANSCFFMAVATMPLGEAAGIFFVAPLIITALSALLLAEPVGARRWAAVLVGLAGVMIILRPGGEVFRLVALLPLAAACAYASAQIVTRKLGIIEKASAMAFYIQFTFIVVSALMFLVVGDGRFEPADNPSLQFLLRAWRLPEAGDVVFFLAIGGLNAIGAYLMSQAYRLGEASSIAPFEYSALPLAVTWGYVLWGEVPDAIAFSGMLVVLGSGLYTVHREAVRRRARRRAAASP
jgi:drug/metabolite transporter (DMT)-like permease